MATYASVKVPSRVCFPLSSSYIPQTLTSTSQIRMSEPTATKTHTDSSRVKYSQETPQCLVVRQPCGETTVIEFPDWLYGVPDKAWEEGRQVLVERWQRAQYGCVSWLRWSVLTTRATQGRRITSSP